jgi:succinate dehydrogenase / fumarate reductase flavoprotein subunit
MRRTRSKESYLLADPETAVLAARATLESALERRETRGCHNRADHPKLDESLRVNLVWSGRGRVEREELPPVPEENTSLVREVSTVGKLVE